MRNKLELIGNLGSDPEIKKLDGDKAVAKMTIATWENRWNPNKQDDNGKMGRWEKITEWHNIIVWNDATKKCENLKKGDLVLFEGKVTQRSWDDKEGNKHYITECVGFVTGFPKSQTKESKPTDRQSKPAEKNGYDDMFGGSNSDDLAF